MVQALVINPNSKLSRFFFNIDSHVGVNCSNIKDDVQLVQFGYFAMAAIGHRSGINPELLKICAKVVPGAEYSGRRGDPLTEAICAHQASRGGTLDQRVSPINGACPGGRYDGKHAFMLIPLVWNILDLTEDCYPRIDFHPQCPGILKYRIKQLCGNY